MIVCLMDKEKEEREKQGSGRSRGGGISRGDGAQRRQTERRELGETHTLLSALECFRALTRFQFLSASPPKTALCS